MNAIVSANSNSSLKDLAQYNETYYAIAYSVLTNKRVDVPSAFEIQYNEELDHIHKASDANSSFLNCISVEFPYSLFKPRGHYTRNEELERYFKAMMWLQTAPFCLDNNKHLQRAIISASVLAKNANSMNTYKSLMEPITFIIGEPDNVSFLNLTKIFNDGNYNLEELLLNSETLENSLIPQGNC